MATFCIACTTVWVIMQEDPDFASKHTEICIGSNKRSLIYPEYSSVNPDLFLNMVNPELVSSC